MVNKKRKKKKRLNKDIEKEEGFFHKQLRVEKDNKRGREKKWDRRRGGFGKGENKQDNKEDDKAIGIPSEIRNREIEKQA